VAVPAPNPRSTAGGEGLDEVARRTRSWRSSVVSAPQVLLVSCVGGAGVDEGQACVNRFVFVAASKKQAPPC
jgi:hypothetical protein